VLFTYERAFTVLKASQQRPVVLMVKVRASGSEASGVLVKWTGGQHRGGIVPALGRLCLGESLEIKLRQAGGRRRTAERPNNFHSSVAEIRCCITRHLQPTELAAFETLEAE